MILNPFTIWRQIKSHKTSIETLNEMLSLQYKEERRLQEEIELLKTENSNLKDRVKELSTNNVKLHSYSDVAGKVVEFNSLPRKARREIMKKVEKRNKNTVDFLDPLF